MRLIKFIAVVSAISLQLFFASRLSAAAPGDFVSEVLFPPELIMQNADAIGLTDSQRDAIATTLETVQDKFNELKQRVDKEVETTTALLKKNQIDEMATLAQADKLFSRENEIRRAHLALLISLKNQLTAEQRDKLQILRNETPAGAPAGGPPAAIQEKTKRVQAGIEKWVAEGRDPSEVGDLMQDLGPLMKKWKFKEAEALVDRALKILEGK